MCGIAGIAGIENDSLVDRVRKMVLQLKHRGPDAHGIWEGRGMALGHARLSIIDLDGGKMPMTCASTGNVITFNGEIYNYRSLRLELEAGGYSFTTQSDTEVILAAYAREGCDCLRRLEGMFAFAIYDRANNSLFLARDRFGEKPLYYSQLPEGGVVFASELTALLASGKVKKRIDYASLSKYMTFEYVPADHSLIEGVHKLPAGEWMRVRLQDGQIERHVYWDLPIEDESINYQTLDEAAECLHEKLRVAVRQSMVSDVPLGIFLSGGLDSSLIASYAAEAAPGRLKGFTIGFEDKSFDESGWARMAAERCGIDLQVRICTESEVEKVYPRALDALDEPIGDASIVPTYLLSGFAREQVKVVLSGDGGDELFAGYPTFQALKLIRIYNAIPSVFRPILKKMAASLPVSFSNISFDFKIKQLLRGTGVSEEIMFFYWMGSFHSSERKSLFLPSVMEETKDRHIFEDLFDLLKQSGLNQQMERCLYLCSKLYLTDDILVKTDRASMAHGLECRAPLLDRNLAEYVCHLPTFYKIKDIKTKVLLKQVALARLPRELVYRKKKGFGMPVARWILSGSLAKTVDEFLMDEEFLRKQGIFQAEFLRALVRDHRERKKDNRKLIWTLIAFQWWYKKIFLDKGSS